MEFEIKIAKTNQKETLALLRYLLAEHDHTIDERLDLTSERIKTSWEHINTYIQSEDHRYFIAYTEDGMPMGFLHARIDNGRKGKYGYLSEMFVLKAYRGHKLGEQLVIEHDKWLHEKGIKTAAVITTAGQKNFQTIKFYRKLGYEEESEQMGGVILTRKIK